MNEEYEVTRKKRDALDSLLNEGRISQSTYDSFNKKIDDTVSELERQQKALLEKMNSKLAELEQHNKTLEMLLANFEIRHVTGEVDEEVYQREVSLLSTGLETARQELDTVREGVNQLSSSIKTPSTEAVPEQGLEPQTIEAPQSEDLEEAVSTVETQEDRGEDTAENLPEPPADQAEGSTDDLQDQPEQEETQETWQNPDETQETHEEQWQNTEETQETWQNPDETQETEASPETDETQE